LIKHLKGIVLLLTISSTMHGQFYEYGKFILTESDKQKHFVAGVVISGISYEFGLKKFEDKKKAAAFALGMSLAAGIAKESYDNWRGFPSYFDDRDILATMMGSVTITIPLFALQKPKKRYKH